MNARLLSMNVGVPKRLEWQGRHVTSSMHKSPVPGPLEVYRDRVELNTFASPQFHGTPDSVIYIYGMTSALTYMRLLGRDVYEPGALGETLTADKFDETEVSVGDVFRVGDVLIQATFPRIPCAKVNLRMQHEQGQRLMEQCGRSGVYFRVLEEGTIRLTDEVRREHAAAVRFSIAEVYARAVGQTLLSVDDLKRAQQNGAFPERILEKWERKLLT